MAHRFVTARPILDRLPELRTRLESGEIESMQPFGASTTEALERARYDPDTGQARWVQQDYCTPPLAQERSAILDMYFEDIEVTDRDVDPSDGWTRIEDLPSLWEWAPNGE